MGQAKEIPRWKRHKTPPGPVINMSGRQAKRMARDMAAAIGTQPPARQEAVASGALARTGAFRFRYQLVPVAHLLAIIITGLACHVAHDIRAGLLLGLGGGLGIWLLTRHLSDTARNCELAQAAMTVFWVPLLALAGWTRPWPPLLLACWIVILYPWARHYKWRPEEAKPEPDRSDMELWDATLGAKGRLAGSRLSLPTQIPSGTKYVLRLRRGEQDTSDVFSTSKKIASLFGKPVTEVYPERFPDGREHEVMLTLLRSNTLAKVRKWDGSGIDPATGLAEVGDFPDGTPAHFRFWSPRNGAEQSVVVGVKGGGKSYLLHLLLAAAVTSEVPVVPIVLDPQQGQSLPDWRGQVPYARGVDQCMAYLRAFEAGMMARSDYLADFAWTDEDGYDRPGMDFYDPALSGLPLIFMVLDEAHLLLGHPKYAEEAKRIIGNLVKLNRKAGGHLMIVSHTLLLTQLGDMTLRAMVVGGNAIALRTGEALSGGIIGLEADPKLLPRTFPDGSETHGLGYIVGPDNRPDSPMRVRLVPNPRKVAVDAPAREMDAVFGDAFRGVLGRAAPQPQAAAPLAAIPVPEDDKPGRTAADAILAVLDEAGRELDRGQIITRMRNLVTGEWGRAEPFGVRATGDALGKLTAEGKIEKTGHGSYAPVRARLHVVAGNTGPTAGEGRG
jgi:hypothetical protein